VIGLGWYVVYGMLNEEGYLISINEKTQGKKKHVQ
jgi:hypothetical protein